MDGVPDDGSSTFSFIQTTTFSYAVRAISKRNMDASIPPQIRGDGHTNHCATYVRFLATNYIVSQGFGILMATEEERVRERVGNMMNDGAIAFVKYVPKSRKSFYCENPDCRDIIPSGSDYVRVTSVPIFRRDGRVNRNSYPICVKCAGVM